MQYATWRKTNPVSLCLESKINHKSRSDSWLSEGNERQEVAKCVKGINSVVMDGDQNEANRKTQAHRNDRSGPGVGDTD